MVPWLRLCASTAEGTCSILGGRAKDHMPWGAAKKKKIGDTLEEAEVEGFYEDLQDLLELTPKKDVLFIIGDYNNNNNNNNNKKQQQQQQRQQQQ